MRITITILFLLLHAITYGQKIQFMDTTNIWSNYRWYWSGTWHYNTSFGNQAMLNGISYRKLNNNAYIREDTSNSKKRIIIKDLSVSYAIDTNEYILYDFTAAIGDTLNKIITIDDTLTTIITSLDSCLVDSIIYKKWAWKCFSANYPLRYTIEYYYIENIGCLQGFYMPIQPYVGTSGINKLLCFRNNNKIVAATTLSKNQYYLDPMNCNVSINEIQTKTLTTIAPNPANSHSKITFPYTIQSGTLTITDILGRRLVSKSIFNQTAIPIGELPASGVYFYTITDNYSGNKFAGRFVYQ